MNNYIVDNDTQKYIEIILQKAFGALFMNDIKLDVSAIEQNSRNSGGIAMSIGQEDDIYIISLGIVEDNSSADVRIYAFTSDYLQVLFVSAGVVEIDFCLDVLSNEEFIKKIESHYHRKVFTNGHEIEAKLKSYQRKRKISTILYQN